MFQICPHCNGISTDVPHIRCNVCDNTGLIHTMTGNPPMRQRTEPPPIPKEVQAQIGFFKEKANAIPEKNKDQDRL